MNKFYLNKGLNVPVGFDDSKGECATLPIGKLLKVAKKENKENKRIDLENEIYEAQKYAKKLIEQGRKADYYKYLDLIEDMKWRLLMNKF